MNNHPYTPSEPAGLTKVLKFGGSSVGSAATLRRVIAIIDETAGAYRPIVVVSALSGVTDLLVEAMEDLQLGILDPERVIHALLARHRRLAAEVLSPWAQDSYALTLQQHLEALGERLRKARPGSVDPALRDAVLATGERLSAPLVALALRDAGLRAVAQDAAALIRTDDAYGAANVDYSCSERLVQAWYAGIAPDEVPVVTGFLGATDDGATTTLGRGGSDYSAALIARALRAHRLERWTDVDGLYTDDPRRNPDARPVAHLSLDQALDLNHADRLGMHRQALSPLHEAGIPLHVRSTIHAGPGTLICK